MSLRKAALVAAAGSIANLVIAVYYSLSYAEAGTETLLVAVNYSAELLMAIVFALIYREQCGSGDPRRRQDLAILATIASGILLHLSLTHANVAAFHSFWRTANWILDSILLPVCWIVFLILLVKDAEPWTTRPMRALAPVLTVLTVAAACLAIYSLFFRVGLTFLNLGTQRSLSAVVWELLLLPLLEIFRSFSVVIFAAVVWRYSRTAGGSRSQIAGSSWPNTQEQNP